MAPTVGVSSMLSRSFNDGDVMSLMIVKPRTASSAPSTVRLRTRRPITAANSGSGCVSPNSDGTTIGSPWPTRADGGLRKYAGSVGGRWAYCAIDLLLTATPMILEGFGEG